MKKILLVEDNVDIREAVTILLEDEGYTVVSADKEDEVERLSETDCPDLILLDMLLSGTNGGKIATKLKSRENTKHIPIILVSAHPQAKSIALQSGADDFIAKPFDSGDLLNMIKKYLLINSYELNR